MKPLSSPDLQSDRDAPKGSVAAYVISMAKTPSDVLGVHLLLKEAGIDYACRLHRCFETLDDLNMPTM